MPRTVRTIETKLDNAPWAPITPYLSYPDKLELAAGAGVQPGHLVGPGVVTSPESAR